jgi:hypothetical protein
MPLYGIPLCRNGSNHVRYKDDARQSAKKGHDERAGAYWKVKPGLGKPTVDRIAAGLVSRQGDATKTYANIGVHDAR